MIKSKISEEEKGSEKESETESENEDELLKHFLEAGNEEESVDPVKARSIAKTKLMMALQVSRDY